ncbi:methylmalonyl Co-A mutase-associated GTPase MeaB [Lacihabitans lacunae]|uniref:Methylmalonyl Co-A mutase-associated GTPase MeaB n=1 Tax=Lacihabitans lacunae TaxID=1028214 RepID=A0ABV7YUE5_9BACT
MKRLALSEYVAGIKNHDRTILGRAITLIESKNVSDRLLAQKLITEILPLTGNSFRLGITGAPGVGKSTFIDGFGSHILSQGKKLAVLAIDPSSKVSGGSILGDKTRMESLANDKRAFIRPSPAGDSLGGVAQNTLETLLLCEAAGFDFVIVETVGVGQSETIVKDITDYMMFLTISGAGDELQGIKRGIMEMIDMVVINKSDQVSEKELSRLISNINYALHLFPAKDSNFTVGAFTCSALNKTGFDSIYEELEKYKSKTEALGYFKENRNNQQKAWFRRLTETKILEYYLNNTELQKLISDFEKDILSLKVGPMEAAQSILDFIKK